MERVSPGRKRLDVLGASPSMKRWTSRLDLFRSMAVTVITSGASTRPSGFADVFLVTSDEPKGGLVPGSSVIPSLRRNPPNPYVNWASDLTAAKQKQRKRRSAIKRLIVLCPISFLITGHRSNRCGRWRPISIRTQHLILNLLNSMSRRLITSIAPVMGVPRPRSILHTSATSRLATTAGV
jgi:hypothetical protein